MKPAPKEPTITPPCLKTSVFPCQPSPKESVIEMDNVTLVVGAGLGFGFEP